MKRVWRSEGEMLHRTEIQNKPRNYFLDLDLNWVFCMLLAVIRTTYSDPYSPLSSSSSAFASATTSLSCHPKILITTHPVFPTDPSSPITPLNDPLSLLPSS